MAITKARFTQLEALGREHGMPAFTHSQMSRWQAARAQRIEDGGPFTVVVTGTDGCARHIADAVVPYLREVALGKIEFVEKLIGWPAMKEAGITHPNNDPSARFPKSTWQAMMKSDGVLLVAVGSEFDDPGKHSEILQADRPQDALLDLRYGFDLFTNIRPCRAFNPLRHLSPLRPELTDGVGEVTVVRELVRGLYNGRPKGYVQPGG